MAFEAYLYVDGIRGDSTSAVAKEYTGCGQGPIEIKNYGLGIEMPMVENRSGTGAATIGRANFEDFDTSKNIDCSTSSLFFFCLSGKHIPKAVVRIYRSTGDGAEGKSTLYLEIIYEHVIITELGINGGGDEMPTETLKFNYGIATYRYQKTNKTTGAGTGMFVEFKWDRYTNSGTKSAQ